jgi:16S rRNA A1518/A1519 N6-dimethyltransferase RsmA/KsgA/DIM1 with predicted DNA glycosylase/AP lyase activity
VPRVISDADLAHQQLELGPGPGLTTDLLRMMVPQLTAIEIDPKWAVSLLRRSVGGKIEVVVRFRPSGAQRQSGS